MWLYKFVTSLHFKILKNYVISFDELVCVWIPLILLEKKKNTVEVWVTVHWPKCTVHGNSARGASSKKKKKSKCRRIQTKL